ncbi:MAG: metal ABC transporter permease [Planctomycetales bacterium]|nr:metal ABC transporter permease [Planctomycetales bacterium]
MPNSLTWEIDGWIILAGALCATAAALLGNFLVLRRMSLLGDAISHAVLPGLVAAFLFTGERQGVIMFIGAASVGVLTVLLTEFARQVGKVDEGAAIGVVFTFLFAVGLMMVSRWADHVDLDPGCVLYGALETTIFDSVHIGSIWVPRTVITLGSVVCLNLFFVTVFYRQLKVSTFDAELAKSQGVPVGWLRYSLAACVAVTAVAAFESVGNILVVAMFVVPPVTAWLLTDRLHVMIVLSSVIGILCAVAGHFAAMYVPALFGYPSTNTAGMMTVAAGGVLIAAILFAPRKGIVSRTLTRLNTALKILGEDVLATLYRAEQNGHTALSAQVVRKSLLVPPMRAYIVFSWLRLTGQIVQPVQASGGAQLALKPTGRRIAQNVVRAHRLWEQYLSLEAGLPEQLLHGGAERLEHFTDRELREKLSEETDRPHLDPHGAPIPPEAGE